jgi:fructose-bisphosphate aldolase, class I
MGRGRLTLETLKTTAQTLFADDKGLLAMDESTSTCNRRFARLGIPQTEDARRAWREVIVTTPGLGDAISGAILFDETIRQSTAAGVPFAKVLEDAGIMPGIKVDLGAKDLACHPGETITEGLDGLRERFAEYLGLGARFAKWRAAINLGDGLPTRSCINANAHALARYAALAQEAGLVPIVEPEVVMAGDQPLETCRLVTEMVLHAVFDHLHDQSVVLEAMVLKPNMVAPGLACPAQASSDEVAEATVACLRRAVPAAVPGIAFLSGGQSDILASERLNAMAVLGKAPGGRLPWRLSFSYGRALQRQAPELWRGDAERATEAQKALYHRADCNRAARRGDYSAAMEAA